MERGRGETESLGLVSKVALLPGASQLGSGRGPLRSFIAPDASQSGRRFRIVFAGEDGVEDQLVGLPGDVEGGEATERSKRSTDFWTRGRRWKAAYIGLSGWNMSDHPASALDSTATKGRWH